MSQFCVCDEADTCYSPGTPAPTIVILFPYCTDGVCHMYAVQKGADAASLVSASKTYILVDQFTNEEKINLHNMSPTLNPQVYIYASKISCSGCSSIQGATCTGPASPVSG